MCPNNFYIDGRTQGFPAEHCPNISHCLRGLALQHRCTQPSTWCKWMGFMRPGHLLLLLCGPVLMLMYPLLVPLVADRSQHGNPDLSAAMQPHTQQAATHNVFWQLSIWISINSLAIWVTVVRLLDRTTRVSTRSPHASLSLFPNELVPALPLLLPRPNLIDTDAADMKLWPHRLASQFGPCQTNSNPFPCPFCTASNTPTLRRKCSLSA